MMKADLNGVPILKVISGNSCTTRSLSNITNLYSTYQAFRAFNRTCDLWNYKSDTSPTSLQGQVGSRSYWNDDIWKLKFSFFNIESPNCILKNIHTHTHTYIYIYIYIYIYRWYRITTDGTVSAFRASSVWC